MKKRFFCLIFIFLLSISLTIPANAAVKNYYGQLNSNQKSIYNQMFNHFYKNNSSKSLDIILNKISNTMLITQLQANYLDDMYMAYSALLLEHPEYYWIGSLQASTSGNNIFDENIFSYSILSSASITLNKYISRSKSTIKKYNKAVKKAAKKVKKYAGKKPSKTKLVKAINKWIIKNTKYSYKNGSNTAIKYRYLHSSYGVFVKKKAVCDGYSKAFKALCDYYKIPCMINSGYAYDSSGYMIAHAWNLVKIGGKWYIVDSTWNDTGKANKWLLCGTKTVKSTHKNHTQRLDVKGIGYFKLPKISKKDK